MAHSAARSGADKPANWVSHMLFLGAAQGCWRADVNGRGC
jgi:hypothetical protein